MYTIDFQNTCRLINLTICTEWQLKKKNSPEQQFAKCAKKWPTKTSCQNIVHSCLEWQFAAFEDKNCSVCKKSLSTTICKRIVRKGNFLNKIYQVNQCGICFVYLVLFWDISNEWFTAIWKSDTGSFIGLIL